MKTVVQRWLMVFAAFVMVALVVLSGCTEADARHEVATQQPTRLEKTTNRALHRDASIRARPALPAPSVQRDKSQSRRLLSLEQAQRARRMLARW